MFEADKPKDAVFITKCPLYTTAGHKTDFLHRLNGQVNVLESPLKLHVLVPSRVYSGPLENQPLFPKYTDLEKPHNLAKPKLVLLCHMN